MSILKTDIFFPTKFHAEPIAMNTFGHEDKIKSGCSMHKANLNLITQLCKHWAEVKIFFQIFPRIYIQSSVRIQYEM